MLIILMYLLDHSIFMKWKVQLSFNNSKMINMYVKLDQGLKFFSYLASLNIAIYYYIL